MHTRFINKWPWNETWLIKFSSNRWFILFSFLFVSFRFVMHDFRTIFSSSFQSHFAMIFLSLSLSSLIFSGVLVTCICIRMNKHINEREREKKALSLVFSKAFTEVELRMWYHLELIDTPEKKKERERSLYCPPKNVRRERKSRKLFLSYWSLRCM